MYVSDTKSGNPYHNSSTGQFETKYGGFNYKGKEIKSWEDLLSPEQLNKYNLATDEQKEKIKQGMYKIYSELAKTLGAEEIKEEQPQENKEEEKAPKKGKKKKISENKNVDKEALCKQFSYLDKNLVDESSDEEFNDLKKSLDLLKAEGDAIKNDPKLKELSKKKFYDLWVIPVDASKFSELNYDGKLNYFKVFYKGDDTDDKVNQLYELKQLGEQYQNRKEEIQEKFKIAKDLVDKYTKKDYAYSNERKSKALDFKNSYESKKYFAQSQKEYLENLKKTNGNAFMTAHYYTGSFSSFNEPLRKEKYTGGNVMEQGFVNQVKALTEAIDGAVLKNDMWVQRGVNKLTINNELTLTEDTSQETLNKLVGQVFSHQSFYSAGAAQTSGFTEKDIILRTYCPKGTKGLYVDEFSQFSGENEIILQRGYQYRITKVEKNEYGRISLDVEVILDSDKNKYNEEQLKQIEEQYVEDY